MNRFNPKTDVSAVEQEIEWYCHNYYIPREDAQLFAMIDPLNYYPIFTSLDSNGKIVVEDTPDAVSLELFVGTKRQFLYKQYVITHSSIVLELTQEFKTGWNPKNYLVFRNGLLLNSIMYDVYCPSFTSVYTVKSIYSQTKFLKGDRIDVFYIEADDRFKPVQFNHDVFIKNVKQFCEIPGQLAVRIPYPYASYPRQTEMFYVFNTQTKRYLTKDVDYAVEAGGQYIILKDETILTAVNEDSLTFVFPYCMSEYEFETANDLVGEESGISFFISYSQWEPKHAGDVFSPTGIIEFNPPFSEYDLTKDNFLLFCNNTYMHPDKYDFIDNTHIKLLDPMDAAHAEFAKYTMLIFHETDSKAKLYRSFEFQAIPVIPTMDNQSIIDLPIVNPANTGFMAFEGALMFDVHEKFTWDKSNNQIIVHDPSSIKAGRQILFVFYLNVPDKKKYKHIEIVTIKFESLTDDSVTMKNTAGYRIQFNKKNCIIFMNGTYLDPERYEISENILKFTNPLDKLRAHKAFTGVYLVSHLLHPDTPYDILDDIRDGYPNKLLWFDEMKAKPIIEEIEVPDSTVIPDHAFR